QVNITLEAGEQPADAHLNGVFHLSQFVAAGSAASNTLNSRVYNFNPRRFANLRDTKRICASGYIYYRDAGQRVWQTGFAMMIELDDNLEFVRMYPVPKRQFWFDSRRK